MSQKKNTNKQDFITKLINLFSKLKSIIDVLSFFILVATLFVTSITIFEMKKERNESHKAFIIANNVSETMAFYGDINQIRYPNMTGGPDGLIYPSSYVRLLDPSAVKDPSYHLGADCETYSLPREPGAGTFTQIDLLNIGQGIATKISCSWDSQNIQKLYKELHSLSKESTEYIGIHDMWVNYHLPDYPSVSMNDNAMRYLSIPTNTYYSYMLPNCNESYIIEFPIVYSVFFSYILLYDIEAEPSVKLNIEFSDTQGVKYHQIITMKAVHDRDTTLASPSTDEELDCFGGTRKLSEDESPDTCYGISYTITMDYSTPIQK